MIQQVTVFVSQTVLAILVLFFAMSCEQPVDIITIDLSGALVTPAPFAPGVISTPLNERDIAISPDGNEIFYTLNSADNGVRAIVQLVRNGESWNEPQVAAFSGQHSDIEATFSQDGNTVFFASNRPINPQDSTSDYNIWQSRRIDSGWGEAELLPEVINSDEDEYFPSVATNGNLYFTSCREDCKGIEDIYVSKYVNGVYQQASSLDAQINTATYEFNAYIAPDESFIIFGSWGREDGFGGGDLYISYRDNTDGWSEAVNMGADINSSKLDYCPFYDMKRGTLYFSSDRRASMTDSILDYHRLLEISAGIQNGLGNIYSMKWTPSGNSSE